MGELNLGNQSGENIFRLLVVSDELLLKELFQFVQDHFIENETNWIQQNFILIIKTIFNIPNYEKLQRHCIASFCKDPLPIISSNDFLSLDKDILLSLLKRDDLNILFNSDDCNVTIQIKENQNIKEFRAHSNILRLHSPYFKDLLLSNKIKNENNVIIFDKPHITPTVFEIVLK